MFDLSRRGAPPIGFGSSITEELIEGVFVSYDARVDLRDIFNKCDSFLKKVIFLIAVVRPRSVYQDSGLVHCYPAIRSLKDSFALCQSAIPDLDEYTFQKALADMCRMDFITIQYCFSIQKFTLWQKYKNKNTCHYGYNLLGNVVNLADHAAKMPHKSITPRLIEQADKFRAEFNLA